MSNYPGYNQFQHPGQGQGFAPPPQPGQGFAPPQPGQGFAPPVSNGPPPAVQTPGQGFAPPPPGGSSFSPPGPPGQGPPAPMNHLNSGMGGMNLNQPNQFQPPPSGSSGPIPPRQGMAPGPQPPSFQAPNNPAPTNQFHGHPPAAPGAIGTQQPPQGFIDESLDFDNVIPKSIFRPSSSTLPATASMAASCKVPIGGVLRPFANPDESELQVVQPGAAGIIRCKRCRTYINPFVGWLENGRRWRCNICAQLNETASAYFCHLDEKNRRRDEAQRPELNQSVVEWVAPSEYMVRAPQAPAFYFVLDVSMNAVRSGMLASAARAIKKSLDDLPGGDRTMVGFITFDTAVHYYALKPGTSNPQMMVVGDLKELFVPAPDDLLVFLRDSRDAVESFLDNLPTMFANNTATESCLGPALKAAFTVVKAVGGKMSVFQSSMPTLGDGALKPRENARLMGTPNEVKVLKPESTWYKDTAIEFSRAQISVDMYLFPNEYIDVAALSELPKTTAGTLNTYVGFNAATDGPKFESRLCRRLTQQTAFEAVLRIRCTKGMRISNFYGNFFVRGTDLLALPNCSSDSVFGFDLAHDEQSINTPSVTIQSALLYTSSNGERRIRVATQLLRTTSKTSEFMASVDSEACAALLAKQAMMVTIKSNLDNARNRLQQTCVEMFNAAKGGDKRTVSGYTMPQQQQDVNEGEHKVPKNLQLLPLYTLSLLKNVAFRGGTDVHPDERIAAHMALSNMYVDETLAFIHPRLYAIHNMDANAGMSANEDETSETAGRNKIMLPNAMSLSVDKLSSEGVYLLDNGSDAFIWVGRACNPAVISALFDTDSLVNIDPNQLKLNSSGNDLASRLDCIIEALHEESDPTLPQVAPKIQIICEGDMAMEARFFWNFIEDRAQFNGGTYSYAEFMQFCSKPPGSAPPAPPGGAPGPMGGPNNMGRGPPPGSNRGGPPGPSNMAPPYNGGMPPVPQGPSSMPPPYSGGMPPAPQGPGPPSSGPPTSNSGQGPPTPNSGYGMPPPPNMGQRHPPAPNSGYGMPPPAPNSGYGMPPPAPNSGYGMPPPAPNSGYGMPPPAPNSGYGMPPPAPNSGYGMPPPAPNSGYGMPPQNNQGQRAPPAPSPQHGMPPPPR